MDLTNLASGSQKRKLKKRVGRGIGSGHGKTAGKGHKGHSSRQGFKISPIFEGGQMPLARRVPKRGFVNGAFKKCYVVVNLKAIEERFPAGSVVDEKALRALGLVKGQEFDGIKILATGALSKPLEVHATKFSASAAAKIAAAGGKSVVVPYRPHAVSGRPEKTAPPAP